MAVDALGATFATVLAAGTGPLAPFVAAAATPLTTQLARKVAAEWSRKSRVIAGSALEASQFSTAEDFANALTGDPDMIALTQKVLWAASVSGSDQKLRALGDLLGRAARQGDRLDETQFLVAALTDLEAPHLLALDALREEVPAPQIQPGGATYIGKNLGWGSSQVASRINLDPDFALACLNALTRHGLATEVNVLGEARFMITRLGQAIALAMHRPGREPEQGA